MRISTIVMPALIVIAGTLWGLTGMPNYIGASLVVLCCGLFVGLLALQSAQLSEAERRILALMLRDNHALEHAAFGVPKHLQIGKASLFAKGETPTAYAPVATKYLSAFDRLQAKRLIKRYSANSPIFMLTEEGARAAQRAPLEFQHPPVECNGKN